MHYPMCLQFYDLVPRETARRTDEVFLVIHFERNMAVAGVQLRTDSCRLNTDDFSRHGYCHVLGRRERELRKSKKGT
jgi:hypothetical protein